MSTLTQTPNALTTPPPSRLSTPPPPPPPSKAIPTDFRSSLAAWWNNSSYREARIAEERLLRRMSMYQPPEPGSPATAARGWFNFPSSGEGEAGGSRPQAPPIEGNENVASNNQAGVGDRAGEQVVNEDHAVPPVNLPGTSLVATLRNVFISTPDPSLAPQHPADPHEPGSTTSSLLSLDSQGSKKACKPHNPLTSRKRAKEGKMVDYINTLEISNPEHSSSKEAVVVLHGYAAALG